MSIATIKAKIKTELDEMSELDVVQYGDVKKDPLDAELFGSVSAFIMPPGIETELLDNRTNIRNYTFELLVVMQAENITSSTDIETVMEAILDKFNNNPNLDGVADATSIPAVSAPQPLEHKSKELIIFNVILEVRETVDLSFS